MGGEIVTVSHLERTMYLLGYIPRTTGYTWVIRTQTFQVTLDLFLVSEL